MFTFNKPSQIMTVHEVTEVYINTDADRKTVKIAVSSWLDKAAKDSADDDDIETVPPEKETYVFNISQVTMPIKTAMTNLRSAFETELQKLAEWKE